MSQEDRKLWSLGDGVELDHVMTCVRILGVLTDAKKKQLKYAATKGKPGILVVFDCSTWSGFGTDVHIALRAYLDEPQNEFAALPPELSALIYLERRVNDGEIELILNPSAIIRNPLAAHPLPDGILNCFQRRPV